MKIKLLTFLGSILFSCALIAQNDFSIHWSSYESGETVLDSPFMGSFKITNVGETTILANDTIWYGYRIDGQDFDLGLSPELVSGQVLSEDFEPGMEISVLNIFDWPLWGSGITINVCAVVYGEGIDSYLNIPFYGDIDSTNNVDCLNAVLPDYELSIVDYIDYSFKCYMSQGLLAIENLKNFELTQTQIIIHDLSGNSVYDQLTTLTEGQNLFNLPEIETGIYILSIVSQANTYSFKLVL